MDDHRKHKADEMGTLIFLAMHAQMLARMKQDASAPSQRGDSPFEQVPPLGGPASARRPDPTADDATPRTGGLHARKPSQLVRLLRLGVFNGLLASILICISHRMQERMRARMP